MNANDVTNALAIPKRILYSCMPISGIIMLLYSIKNVIIGFISIIKPLEKLSENDNNAEI
jgi:TRAP-type C4-dicarboxylate transport system permease small subunit